MLGEFGWATNTLDPRQAAIHEVATYLGLLAEGAAGGSKWMLNDMPEGFNMRERTLGAFTVQGVPKPMVAALRALRSYLDRSGAAPGTLLLEDEGEGGLRFAYQASDGLLLGGRRMEGDWGVFTAEQPALALLSWSEPGYLDIWVNSSARIEVDLERLTGRPLTGEVRVTSAAGGSQQAVGLAREGSRLVLSLPGEGWHKIEVGPRVERGADYAVADGWFFTQTNGRPVGESGAGFSVTNTEGIPFWSAFQAMGGLDVLGFPVSRRFVHEGFEVQAFQKGVLQWRPDQGEEVWLLNVFDAMHDRGLDDWLAVYRQIPAAFDATADTGLSWEQVVEQHLKFLDDVPPALRERFLGNPDWVTHYGLPVAVEDYPSVVVVRAQRAAFQYWKEDVPWARGGDIFVVNGGDLAKEAGMWPWLASTPENARW